MHAFGWRPGYRQIDGPLDFTTLKKRLDVADGALGLHLRQLEETGYITCTKAFIGRRPHSTYRITRAGRTAFRDYLSKMRELIDAVAKHRAPRG